MNCIYRLWVRGRARSHWATEGSVCPLAGDRGGVYGHTPRGRTHPPGTGPVSTDTPPGDRGGVYGHTPRGQGRCLRTHPPGDRGGVYGHTPRGQGRCPRTHPPGTGDSLPGHRPPPGTGTVSRGRIPQESRQPPLRPRLAVPLPGVCVLRDCPLSQMAPPDMDLVLSKARLGSQKPRRCLHPHP